MLSIQTKTLRRKLGQQFHDIGFGNEFLAMTPKVGATKEKLRYLRFHIKFVPQATSKSKKATYINGRYLHYMYLIRY